MSQDADTHPDLLNFSTFLKKEMERKPKLGVRVTTQQEIFEKLQNLSEMFNGTALFHTNYYLLFAQPGKKIHAHRALS